MHGYIYTSLSFPHLWSSPLDRNLASLGRIVSVIHEVSGHPKVTNLSKQIQSSMIKDCSYCMHISKYIDNVRNCTYTHHIAR